MTLPLDILADPAFLVCLASAASNAGLVAQYDRLRGTNLSRAGTPIELAIDDATGRLDAEARDFAAFVHDTVYTRLDAPVLQQLRELAAEAS